MEREDIIKMYEAEYNNKFEEVEYLMSYVAKDLIDFAEIVVNKLSSQKKK